MLLSRDRGDPPLKSGRQRSDRSVSLVTLATAKQRPVVTGRPSRTHPPGVRPTLNPLPPEIPPPILAAPSPSPQPTLESAEVRELAPTRGGDTSSGPVEERETEVQHHRQANQDAERRHRRPKRNNARRVRENEPGGGAATAERRQAAVTPPQVVAQPRQKRNKCLQCNRWGHSVDQCQVLFCEYCQGRYHSSQNCRVKLADQRQQELVQAVRQSSQETLIALRGVAWQLQHPPHPPEVSWAPTHGPPRDLTSPVPLACHLTRTRRAVWSPTAPPASGALTRRKVKCVLYRLT